jgi:hypothetical protein
MKNKEEIVIEVKSFSEEIKKSSSDCWIKSKGERNNTKTHGITVDRLIAIAFQHQIKTYDSWCYEDPEVVLQRKLFMSGVNETPRYRSENKLYDKLCNFKHYNSLSGAEKKLFDALKALSYNYRWKLYLSLYRFIDSFLF